MLLMMLMSDLPFIDDVKKGERYLERERYFAVTLLLCYFVMLCWTPLLCTCLPCLCWTSFYFCVVDMYLLCYVFMSCMTYFLIYNMS